MNPDPQQFISTLFLVEKYQGTLVFCLVINLKALNRFLPEEKFNMEGAPRCWILAPQGRLHDEARSARRRFCSSYFSVLLPRCPLPTSQGEDAAVAALRPGGSSPTVAFAQLDCMADIGKAYQAAGFPEGVTDNLLASWSQSIQKRYRGPWRDWSDSCS